MLTMKMVIEIVQKNNVFTCHKGIVYQNVSILNRTKAAFTLQVK